MQPVAKFFQHPTDEAAFIVEVRLGGRAQQSVVRNAKAKEALEQAGKLRPASELS